MRIKLTVGTVILIVVCTALFGMILGGMFGYVAGMIAPGFFRHLVAWTVLEPIGVAVTLGAFGGVVCGGCLGGFAVSIQALLERNRSRE